MHRGEAVRRCYQIPGVTWPSELGALWDLCSGSRSHIEVGSFCGRSLFVSAMALDKKAKLTIVEPHIESEAFPTQAWGKGVLLLTLGAIEEWRPDLRICHLEMGSVEAMRSAPMAESVFIDADHHYAEVKADILGWRSKLMPGGKLFGHDYWPADAGVMQAVNECCRAFDVLPSTRIWVDRS